MLNQWTETAEQKSMNDGGNKYGEKYGEIINRQSIFQIYG